MRRALSLGLLMLALPCAAGAQGTWSSRLSGPRARAELSHPERAVRIRAARTLGVAGEPRRSVAALLDALEAEEDVQVRPALMDALARRGDPAAVPRLASRLGEAGREDRAVALRTIGAIGGESAIRVLIEWLGASDVGDDAADALAWIGAPAVPQLLRALRAPAAAERAARTLGRIGDARATPALVLALGESLPAVRVAAAQALFELADERAAPALSLALDGPTLPVAAAALAALARCGGRAYAPAVAQLADGAPANALAIGALATMDPALAAPRVLAIVEDPRASPALSAAIAERVIERPALELVPALAALTADPTHGAAAREALARVPEGGGMEALLALSGPERAVPLALAVRRHRRSAGGALLSRARQALAADDSLRGAVISALAGDAAALPRLERALSAPAPRDRAIAALGLALLGAEPARPWIEARLVTEQDPRAFRALALAARALGVSADASRLEARLADPETAPEALALAARALEESSEQARRRLRRTARRALRADEPRVRAGAALALGEAGDRSAWRALVALLEDEHDAVRLAAARSLASLDVEASREALAARERVERHPGVRRALRAALDRGRPAPAVLTGGEALYVRIAAAPGMRDVIDVDVLLPDGRWLRTSALDGGEVLLPDLPAGEADLHVRL